MSDLAIKIENVSKEYRLGAIGGTTLREEFHCLADKILHRVPENPDYGKKFMALRNINLEVRKGEALGIIGHNGAGKSTLLKLISRVTGPTTGTISYNGRITSMLEVGTGFHGELTGRENIYMNGAILGMTKREIDRKIDAIIDFAEMEKFIDTPVKRYSSGMYVKLAFSVAAHLDSEIMIMDEVLAVGDTRFQQKCLDMMGQCTKKEGRTILYVSHNLNTIQYLCDSAIVMNHGEIVFKGTPEDAIAEYTKDNRDMTGGIRDVSSWPRPNFVTGHAKFVYFELLNAHDCKLKSGMKLKLLVRWRTVKDVANLVLRCYLRHKSRVPVGTATIGLGNVLADEEHVDVFELDYLGVMPGKYTLGFEMHTIVVPGSEPLCQDSLGHSVFELDILGNENQSLVKQDEKYPDYTFSIPWRHGNWGGMRFQIKRIEG